jgi:hypothetical protein
MRCPYIWAAVLLAALFNSPVLSAQAERTVSGTVRDAASGKPLSGAMVALMGEHRGPVATTGAAGRFSIRIPSGSARLLAVRIGFAPDTVELSAADRGVTISLRAAAPRLEALVVSAEPVPTASSSALIRQLDLALRPRESSQELLRLVPGLVIAQHAGGGKAEQIFLRGFDADHGTDVAVSVDGTPVNMVSHAHGQGYADLHFLLPEVVEAIEVRKGSHAARDGNFATAGAVEFRTRDRIGSGTIEARGGSFATGRVFGTMPFGGDAERSGGFLAAAVHYSDGPFQRPQSYGRVNLFGKWTAPVSRSAEIVASAAAFDGTWDASGQIPARVVAAGLSRYGAIDATEGGHTSRYQLDAGLRSRGSAPGSWSVRAYAVRYRLDLFSNFTYFLNDPINGDGIRQVDRRTGLGIQAEYERAGLFTAGAGVRADLADVSLSRQEARRFLGDLVSSQVRELNGFSWIQHTRAIGGSASLVLGVRADLFRFAVGDRTRGAEGPAGSRTQVVVSPKAGVRYRLSEKTALFANASAGFHSNDARDAVAASPGTRILPRAVEAELGTRHTWSGGSVAGSVWAIDLESELVWIGDEGTTEAAGRSRRVGVDLEARARISRWLWADADVNLSHGRLRDEPGTANRIPLAPTVTATGGLAVRDLGALSGGFRIRHIGERPADETNSVRALGYTVGEVFAKYQAGRIEALLTIDNLFGATWNEAQFATTSRLRGEAVPSTELHFTPGAPRNVQVGLRYRF